MDRGDEKRRDDGDRWVETERLQASRAGGIERAAELLRGGGLVAFPTETVYGLGADALSESAVERIFLAKQRPKWDPLIVHVCDEAMLARVAAPMDGMEGVMTERVMAAFWPGPLTLLLPRAVAVPDAVTAGRRMVGVRMPRHAVALALIRAAGLPIAAPSANRFGHTSPTTAVHVLDDLEGRIEAVLDGGACAVGVESTVAEVTAEGVTIYRPGAVTESMLEAVVGRGKVRRYAAGAEGTPENLPSPGMGMRHYAPRARLILAGEGEWVARVAEAGGTVGVMLPDGWDRGAAAKVFRWGAWGDVEELARRLFAGLRALDEEGATVIVCPVPEGEGMGAALRDRLERAARG